MDHDPAFGKRDSQVRRLDLKDEALEGDGVVVADGAFFFDRENQIKINVRSDWDKGRSRLFGFNREALVELADVGLLQEKIGILFGFDTVQTKFVTESALKGFIDTLATTSCLRRIGRDRTDAQFCESASDLSQMAFEDLAAGFWGKEEMACPVRIQGAEDAAVGDAISEQEHAG